MKAFWVLGYNVYYTAADNFLASFETRTEALEYILECINTDDRLDKYDIIDVTKRI